MQLLKHSEGASWRRHCIFDACVRSGARSCGCGHAKFDVLVSALIEMEADFLVALVVDVSSG